MSAKISGALTQVDYTQPIEEHSCDQGNLAMRHIPSGVALRRRRGAQDCSRRPLGTEFFSGARCAIAEPHGRIWTKSGTRTTLVGQMTPPVENRRKFLRLTLGAAAVSVSAALLGRAPGVAAQTATSPLRTTQIRDGLVMIESDQANVLLLATPAGGVLVDSGAPEQVAALSKAVGERLGGVPLAALFNTHWHLDHTGGNDAFGKAGTKIIAHENTRLWMSTEYYVDWQDTTYEPRSREALPNDTFFSSEPQPRSLELGGERIEYGHLREAHTDGDIYVLFRERNVLAAGGAVGGGAYPIIDYATGGWIGGLIEANKKLLDLANDKTLIVGHAGAVQTRKQLVAQHDMLKTMRERVEELMRKGKSAAEMIASGVTRDYDGRYGTDGALFIRNVYEGLWWAGRLTNSL